jgi:hypothetical protein
MFGLRADGKEIKNLDPLTKATPLIMDSRNGAQNKVHLTVDCEKLDNFIDEQYKLGKSYGYFDIILTSIIRLLAQRPKLNRFISYGRYYDRNNISVSMTIKKVLSDLGDETTVKIFFNGDETIEEVHKKFNEEVYKCKGEDDDKTLKFLNVLTHVPHFLMVGAVGLVKLLDRWGLFTNKVLAISPFHSSIYLTQLKSIKLDYVYHHLYNFGNTSLFMSIGKERWQPMVCGETNEIKSRKIMNIGFTMDDRICDGLYFGNSLRLWKKILNNLDSLTIPIDLPKKLTKKELKELKKNNK